MNSRNILRLQKLKHFFLYKQASEMSLFNHETDEEQKSDKKIKTYYFSTKNMKNLRG